MLERTQTHRHTRACPRTPHASVHGALTHAYTVTPALVSILQYRILQYLLYNSVVNCSILQDTILHTVVSLDHVQYLLQNIFVYRRILQSILQYYPQKNTVVDTTDILLQVFSRRKSPTSQRSQRQKYNKTLVNTSLRKQ